ncbi:MAG: hypothetical protein ABH872_06410 [Candidatus Omnitrophota bacterium]
MSEDKGHKFSYLAGRVKQDTGGGILNTKKCVSCLMSFVFCLLMGGCALKHYSQELSTLKGIGINQKQIQNYIDRQKKLFANLVNDTLGNQLEKGTAKEVFLDKYGDPVLVKNLGVKSEFKEKLLYRDPVNYFSSDKVYIYFDKDANLVYWEYMPHSD